jgi:hypothetical protein
LQIAARKLTKENTIYGIFNIWTYRRAIFI